MFANRFTALVDACCLAGTLKRNLLLTLDHAVKDVRPDGWRGVEPKERVIKAALYDVLGNEAEVERVFAIIKTQREY